MSIDLTTFLDPDSVSAMLEGCHSFQPFFLGSLVEERLVQGMDNLARDVLSDPGQNIISLIDKNPEKIAYRLNLTLSSS